MRIFVDRFTLGGKGLPVGIRNRLCFVSEMTQVAPIHVLIIGAGVVGVTLAQALKKHGISFSIFERDEHAGARGQGWGITIHWALSSLESCLPDELRERLQEVQVDPEQGKVDKGNFLFLNMKTGEIDYKIPPNRRMRLKRESFRRLLIEDLPVQWNKKLVKCERTNEGVTAYFEDGTIALGTVLIGVEGGKSQTRQVLCPDTFQLQPLPIRGTGVAVRFTPEQVAPLRAYDPLLFQGMHPETGDFLWFSIIDTPQSNATGGNYYTVQFIISWHPRDPDGKDEMPPTTSEQLAGIKRRASNFAEPFRTAVLSVPDDTPVTELKLADWPCLEWDNHGGRMTLAGDAAHAMTMYRGEAANHGITDAANLVKVLESVKEGTVSLQEAIDGYENEVRKRTAPAVLLSRQACLDAHDWNTLKKGNSPLLARRTVNLK